MAARRAPVHRGDAIDWLEHRDKSKPFFMNFWPYEVHNPIQAPADLIAKTPGKDDKYCAMIHALDIAIGTVLNYLPLKSGELFDTNNSPELIKELSGEGLAEAARYGGALMFLFAVVQFFAAPVLGNLSDRFGRRPVLLFSLAAPLALYRGPLNVWGMGLAVSA